MTIRSSLAPAVLAAALGASAVEAQTPRAYPLPAVTTWAPAGCRGVPYVDDVMPARNAWRSLHGDVVNSDEVSHAFAPLFHEGWTAEVAMFNPTGPVFDGGGNLYFAPFVPYENVVFVSLDAATGARRWAIAGTGAPPGGSAPIVLRDPDAPPGEIVYLALYDRVLAVATDGTIVWDVPSGLTLGPDVTDNLVLGTNYLPALDAIVGLSVDGYLFAVDRRTGAPLLNQPFQLPGAPTPAGAPFALPSSVVTAAENTFQTMVDLPDGGLQEVVWALLGNGVEAANMFAVDPWSGRLWVAGTAPDAEDGTVDGVSQLGALFRLELVPSGGGYDVVEVCHRSFAGGSASTPTLTADGARIYLGDNFGKLLAVRDDCSDAWEVDLGSQIFGSVVVSVDRSEIYASTVQGITKVVDRGGSGEVAWQFLPDVFENLGPSQTNFNINLTTAGANGLVFQAGVGYVLAGTPLTVTLGVGVLDRETGTVRSFVQGGEETVAVMSVGPDGAMYLGNSPIRRLFAKALGVSPAPIRGGITKFAPDRLDLLVRDAACAAAARADNARVNYTLCPASAEADRVQLTELAAQAEVAVAGAVAAGDMAPDAGDRIAGRLERAEAGLIAAGEDARWLRRILPWTRSRMRRVCRALD